MNELIIQYGTQVSIIVRIIAFFLMIFFLIPLQVKEVGVKNGLLKLRYQLLFLGIILLFINFTSVIFLYDDLTNATMPASNLSIYLRIINGIAHLFLSFILLSIYKQQYTEKNKILHEKIDKLERKS